MGLEEELGVLLQLLEKGTNSSSNNLSAELLHPANDTKEILHVTMPKFDKASHCTTFDDMDRETTMVGQVSKAK